MEVTRLTFMQTSINDDSGFTQICVCGRTFNDVGAFTRHEKGCRKGRKRLSGALARAKQVFSAKRARLQDYPRSDPPSKSLDDPRSEASAAPHSSGSLQDRSCHDSGQVSDEILLRCSISNKQLLDGPTTAATSRRHISLSSAQAATHKL